MKTLDKEALVELIRTQARSADLWIAQWELSRDVSGVRNVSLAVGNMFGIYSVLVASYGILDEDDWETVELMSKYSKACYELQISKDIARAISNHG